MMQTVTNALVPSKEELGTYQIIAQTATESKYFDRLGGPAGMLSIMLYAREIGVAPMQAVMGGFSNVQGKITMSAELMGSLIRRDGHKLEILESTNTACCIKGTRRDTGETYTASFTMEEAEAAQLVRAGGAWEKYSSDMLFARCISRLRRRLFSDIATKSYVEGELDDEKNSKSDDEKNSKSLESATEKVITLETEEEKPPVKKYLTHEQCEEIASLVGDDDELAQRILDGYKVTALDEIEVIHYGAIVKNLKARHQIAIA